MNELFVVVSIYAKEGKEEELRHDLIAVVGPSRRDEGNLRYELFIDRADPRRFVFVEEWSDRKAQEKHHNESHHIRHFQSHGIANVDHYEAVHMLARIA